MGDNAIANKNSFIVQMVPELRANIMRDRDWKAIANYQIKNFFNKSAMDPEAELGSLLKLYGSDVYEQFMDDPKCAACGETATQRCSKCKSEWYCSRECQIKKWKGHKEMCALYGQMQQHQDLKEEELKKAQEKEVKVEPKKKVLIEELN